MGARLAPDHLRPPLPLDPSAAAYKDWLHLDVFDHDSGVVAITNASLDGAPAAVASRAIGTALVDVPGQGWFGNLVARPFGEARLGLDAISLDAAAVTIDTTSGSVAASVRMSGDGVELDAIGTATSGALVADRATPFGSGSLGWYAVPRLAMSGRLTAGDSAIDLGAASGYADHCWGRWHWGEDVGWEWGTFLTRAPGPAFVLSRVTDRLHKHSSGTSLEVRLGDRRRRFATAAMTVSRSGRLTAQPFRLPGALAVLHIDRCRPKVPATILIEADDGMDHVELEFTARSVAQVVLADTARRGYSFLHEIVGSFVCTGRIGGIGFADDGLGVVELLE